MATASVYKIIDKRFPDVVLYVGQTRNIRSRKCQWKHDNSFWIKQCEGNMDISIIDTTTLDKIRDCESDWISRLKPKHNVQMNRIITVSTVSAEDQAVYDATYDARLAFHRAVKAKAPEAEIDRLRDDYNAKATISEMRKAMRSSLL